MMLPACILLPILIGQTLASSDAGVYIFPRKNSLNLSDIPNLSPEQARLILAQRLGVSQYHRLGDASESTLSYINQFGGQHVPFFGSPVEKVAELVLIVEGVSPKTAQPLLDAFSTLKPDFTISNVPSVMMNLKLVSDLQAQTKQAGKECSLENTINPSDKSCWASNSKIIHIDLLTEKDGLNAVMDAQARLRRFSNLGEIRSVIILMPESSGSANSLKNSYGAYEMIYTGQRKSIEKPMFPRKSTKSSLYQLQALNSQENSRLIKGVPALCHNTMELCISSTNNCSGHGECFKKYGKQDNNGACFACGCRATNETVTWAQGMKKGWKISYWGGSACHKKDVSSAFWLISTFSIVMVGVVSWGIGLLYSIGEDKLPGVIGSGVSVKQK